MKRFKIFKRSNKTWTAVTPEGLFLDGMESFDEVIAWLCTYRMFTDCLERIFQCPTSPKTI